MKNLLFLLSLLVTTFAWADQKVGVILPLTGDFGYFGQDFKQGFLVGLDKLKAEGHKVPEILFEDDQCLAKSAVSAFTKLTKISKVSLIIGPACSASIKSISPIAQRMKVPVMFVLDAGPYVMELPDPLYSFGFNPVKMAELLAEDLIKDKHRKVSVISEDEEYAILIAEAFENYIKMHDGEIISHELIPVNTADMQSVLTKTLRQKPDVIFYSSAYQAGTFLKKLRTFNKVVPVYGNDTMCVADTIDVAKTSSDNAVCGNVFLDEINPIVQKFIEDYKTATGKIPTSLFYPALGFDSAYIMMKELGVDIQSKPILGTNNKNELGVYDIPAEVLKIIDGKIVKK
ncbi:MAG TPA: penicillin-binding protein activator [Oligoflexia bacterium]|nr:penicillin-binding protein activator [Oligoflexia bacterium]HMP49459.1 penicillin-binding protein activator [Oligoflexia bacterium]